MKPADFAFAVFHQPNGKFPMRAGADARLHQGADGTRGGCRRGSATPTPAPRPIGLTAILDVAKPGDRVLMVSYGSGSGSDGFVWTVTERIDEVRALAPHTRVQLDSNKTYVDYGTYAKLRGKIRMGE